MTSFLVFLFFQISILQDENLELKVALKAQQAQQALLKTGGLHGPQVAGVALVRVVLGGRATDPVYTPVEGIAEKYTITVDEDGEGHFLKVAIIKDEDGDGHVFFGHIDMERGLIKTEEDPLYSDTWTHKIENLDQFMADLDEAKKK